MLICPICSRELKLQSNDKFYCNTCDVSIDVLKANIETSQETNIHVKESIEFLNICHLSQPRYVLSPYKLFNSNFRIDTCKFYSLRNSSGRIKESAFDKLNYNENDYLIACNGFYSHSLVKSFILGLKMHYTDNPIIREEYPKAGEAMQIFTLVDSSNLGTISDYLNLTNAYFAPSLEECMYYMLGDSISEPLISDERALYSLAHCSPVINIGWADSAKNMRNRIMEYIKACVRDTSKVIVSEKTTLPKASEQFIKDFFNHIPSLAVNTDTNDIATFDILNHVYTVDIFSGYKKESSELSSVYKFLSFLGNKYGSSPMMFGVNSKKKYLSKKGIFTSTAEETVVLYWKEREKEFIKND